MIPFVIYSLTLPSRVFVSLKNRDQERKRRGKEKERRNKDKRKKGENDGEKKKEVTEKRKCERNEIFISSFGVSILYFI